MARAVQIIAGILILAGLAGFVYGTDLLPTERGIAYTISAVVALSAGAVTAALGLVVRRLDHLAQALKSPAPAAVVADGVAAPPVVAVDDQHELPLAPPAAAEVAAPAPVVPDSVPEPVAPLPEPERLSPPVPLPDVPVTPAAAEPVPAAPAAPKRERFKLPSFRKSAKVAAGAAAAGAVVAAATEVAAEPAREAAGAEPVANAPDTLPVSEEAVPAPALPEAEEPVTFRLPKAAAEVPVPAAEPAPPEQPPATQRPRIDFAPLAEADRPRRAEPPLAPPRLPKAVEPAAEVPDAETETPRASASQSADDPFAALEAEFDRLIPLKSTQPAPPAPEPAINPYEEADVGHPDHALKIALSDEPMRSDGLPPDAPPPAPEPGRSPLRGGLAGPIELEERELAPPGVEVIGSYESGGARYTMYSDSSVVVEIDGKTLKFGSLEQLREFIEAGSGKA